jgi:hypothetical protein
MRDLEGTYGLSREEIEGGVREQFRAYRATLRDDQRRLLERFELVDMARKVVGVGSVGTRAFIGLLQGRDQGDPLFLQVKEATASVLEGPLGKSRYKQHGERVVHGQRLLQAASDIFLGWTKGVDVNRHYYWRQLRDMKGSAEVEAMAPVGLKFYAGICGWTLARAHARSGDPVAIAAYLGKRDTFDQALTDFSQPRRYGPDGCKHSKASEGGGRQAAGSASLAVLGGPARPAPRSRCVASPGPSYSSCWDIAVGRRLLSDGAVKARKGGRHGRGITQTCPGW